MILVVAGTHQEANELATAREWPLCRDNQVWRYIWRPQQIIGMSGAQILYTGKYYNNPLVRDPRTSLELLNLEDRFEREAHIQQPYVK